MSEITYVQNNTYPKWHIFDETHHKKLCRIVKLVLLLFVWSISSANSREFNKEDAGITILLYHRVGEETKHPSTSVSLAQFRTHLDYLVTENYAVVPLDVLLADMKKGNGTQNKRVAITFDDGFQSIAEYAFAELESRSLPFTVFINSSVHEKGGRDFMTWETMKALVTSGLAKFESHGYTHDSMLGLSNTEIQHSIARDTELIEEKLGVKPSLFSYPYGEIDVDEQEPIRMAGFRAAVGQHSGVAHVLEDHYFQPRFSMSYRYGGLDRLKTALKAIPLAMRQIFPITREIQQYHQSIVLQAEMKLDENFQCFGNGEKLIRFLSSSRKRVIVSLPLDAFKQRRYRINCTMPHEKKDGYFRWKGLVFFGEQ